jgi:DNA-binding transcriptional ArsR family regulator
MDTQATRERPTDPFHAIADRNRRKILDLLLDGERSVQELVPHLGITVGGVSQHLQVLQSAGLVARRADGRRRIYRIEPSALHAIHLWLAKYDRFWRSRMKKLEGYLDND